MGAGRQPSRINIDQDKFAAAAREREAAAATRERANSMNPSQPGQSNRSDYFGQDKFDTLLSNLEREKERFNRRKVRGMLM